MDFIHAIEETAGIKAEKNYMPMQAGDVPDTLASVELLNQLIDFVPNTDLHKGIREFIKWYKDYYNV